MSTLVRDPGLDQDSNHAACQEGKRAESRPLRLCVVGSSTRFLSGLSVYTARLASEPSRSYDVSAILMRRLMPSFLYPGYRRVGAKLTRVEYDPAVRVLDGVDWWAVPTLARALSFLARERPDLVTLQWWTGTVLHSYLVLAAAARKQGARVVLEFHEVQDPGELQIQMARRYVQTLLPRLIRMADGFVVHSEYDRAAFESLYATGDRVLRQRPVAVLPLGPYDHYAQMKSNGEPPPKSQDGCCNLLFFGLIRPYKGLDDLIRAFGLIPREEITQYRLTVVGETWEGWELPAKLIAESPYCDRITFVNRYVHDDEVAAFFREASAVVLPYHRSSASATLLTAMSFGLPVVVTPVGGLAEAVAGYEGAILVPPADPKAIAEAIRKLPPFQGRRFANPHSWDHARRVYGALFDAVTDQERLVRMPS